MDTSSPLPFAAPALQDAPLVCRYTRHAQGSDLSFANIYLLQEKYLTTIAMQGGFLFRHYAGKGRLEGYAFPCGEGDLPAALEHIRRDAEARRRPLRFCLLTSEQKDALMNHFPGVFRTYADRGDADYLYTRSDLAELPGSAFHAKRNHISRFERECPGVYFEPLGERNAHDALAVAHGWLSGLGEEATPSLLHEARAIEHALQCLGALQLCGGILYTAERQPIAMSLASRISPRVADVHYEKCLPEYRGAYALINREVARSLSPCDFINREEDLNSPGLRQAKLSYHPALVLEKYNAVPLPLC